MLLNDQFSEATCNGRALVLLFACGIVISNRCQSCGEILPLRTAFSDGRQNSNFDAKLRNSTYCAKMVKRKLGALEKIEADL
jgi:hypothetical protein